MKLFFTSILCLVFVSVYSQDKNVLSFNQVVEKSKQENKNILLYFSGSDWCAPCVKFKKYFIETAEFKAFEKESILVYNADFPRQKENQKPKEIADQNDVLAEKYNNKGIFPSIFLLDSDGKILKKWEQFPTETLEQFIEKLK
jgi:thioredoxin-related protein